MNYRVVKPKRLAGVLISGAFSLLLASSTLAQRNPTGPPPGTGPPPNNNPNLQDRARQVDEGRLRSAEVDAGAEEKNQKLLQAAIANMKEDFTRIQVLRNDIARNLIARKPLDYKLVSDQTAEINKRAGRLNVYLRARAAEHEKENNSLRTAELFRAL